MKIDTVGQSALLRGIKSLSGEELPSPALTLTDPPAGCAGSNSCIIDYWEGFEAMSKTETFDASFSIGIKGLLSFEAGHKEETVKKVTNHSVVLFIDSRAHRYYTQLNGVAWREGVQRPTPGDEESYRNFYQSYGDRYVSWAATGARYTLALIFTATGEQEAKNVKSVLGLEANIKGVPLEGGIHDKLADGLAKINTSCLILTSSKGTGGIKEGIPSLADSPIKHVNFALSLHTIDLPEPAVIDRRLSSYESVPDKIKVFAPIEKNLSRFDGVAVEAERAQTLRKRIAWIHAVNHFFGNPAPADPKLLKLENLVKEDLAALRQTLRRYEESPSLPVQMPEVQSTCQPMPELSVQGWRSEEFGDPQGKGFELMAEPGCALSAGAPTSATSRCTSSVST
jgi:hypothetical protein